MAPIQDPYERRQRRSRDDASGTIAGIISLVIGMVLMCVITFTPMFMHVFPEAWLTWPPYGVSIGLVLTLLIFVFARPVIKRWIAGA